MLTVNPIYPLFPLLLILPSLGAFAQSPPPLVTGFGGTSLPSAQVQGDSTFCKGGEITLVGTHFATAANGDVWDTTLAWLGGHPSGTICPVLRFSISPSGNSDTMDIALPGLFPNDTCIRLDLVKYMQGPQILLFRDTVCLQGGASTFTLYGLDSLGACPGETLVVDQGSPFPPGGSFSSTGLATLDSVLGIFSVGQIPMGAYFLHYQPDSACILPSNVPVTVSVPDNSAFLYSPSLYCIIDADPVPIPLGLTGGRYHASPPTVVDSLTGRLDLGASGPGVHVIGYTTNGICPSTSFDTVSVQGAPNAQFSYSASSFCKSEPDPLPQVLLQGGVFQASPPGLSLDQITGEIDLGSSLGGAYQVTYSFLSTCQTSFSQTVTLEEAGPPTNFAYPGDTFCKGGIPAAPLLAGDTIGVLVPSPGLSLFPGGAINLAATPPGTFNVLFDVANRCAIDPADTFVVLALPLVDFSYSDSSLCAGEAPLAPNFSAPSGTGGAFSAASGLALGTGGEVDPGGSMPGEYTVTFTTSGPCPVAESASIAILPSVEELAIQIWPDTTLCEGGGIEGFIQTRGAVDFGWSLDGSPLNTGSLNLSLDSLVESGMLSAWVVNGYGCSDTAHQKIQVKESPKLSASIAGYYADLVSVELLSDKPGTLVEWTLLGEGQNKSGQVAASPQALLLPVEIQRGAYSPKAMQLSLSPLWEGCPGRDTSLSLVLAESPVFIPEVITPNGDGKNDSWNILLEPGLDASAYEILLHNRAGGLVCRIHPLDAQWTGDSLPDGVYWWILREIGGPEIQTGGLTIKRK